MDYLKIVYNTLSKQIRYQEKNSEEKDEQKTESSIDNEPAPVADTPVDSKEILISLENSGLQNIISILKQDKTNPKISEKTSKEEKTGTDNTPDKPKTDKKEPETEIFEYPEKSGSDIISKLYQSMIERQKDLKDVIEDVTPSDKITPKTDETEKPQNPNPPTPKTEDTGNSQGSETTEGTTTTSEETKDSGNTQSSETTEETTTNPEETKDSGNTQGSETTGETTQTEETESTQTEETPEEITEKVKNANIELAQVQRTLDNGESSSADISSLLKNANIQLKDIDNDNKITMNDLINVGNEYLNAKNRLDNLQTEMNTYSSVISVYENKVLQSAPSGITKDNLKSKLNSILSSSTASNELKQNASILKDLYTELEKLKQQETSLKNNVELLKAQYESSNAKEFFVAYLKDEIEKVKNSDKENKEQELADLQELLSKAQNGEVINGLQGDVKNQAKTPDLMNNLQNKLNNSVNKAQNNYPTQPSKPSNPINPSGKTDETQAGEETKPTGGVEKPGEVDSITALNNETSDKLIQLVSDIVHYSLAEFDSSVGMESSQSSMAVALDVFKETQKEFVNLAKEYFNITTLQKPTIQKSSETGSYNIDINGKTLIFTYDVNHNNLTSVYCEEIGTILFEYDAFNEHVTNITLQRKGNKISDYPLNYEGTMKLSLDETHIIKDCELDYNLNYSVAPYSGTEQTHYKVDANGIVQEYNWSINIGEYESITASLNGNTIISTCKATDGSDIAYIKYTAETDNHVANWSSETISGIPIKSGKLMQRFLQSSEGPVLISDFVYSGENLVKVNIDSPEYQDPESLAAAVSLNYCTWPDSGYQYSVVPGNLLWQSLIEEALEIQGKSGESFQYESDIWDLSALLEDFKTIAITDGEDSDINPDDTEPQEYTFKDDAGNEQIGMFYPEYIDEDGNLVPAMKIENGTYKNGNPYELTKTQNEDGTWTGEELIYVKDKGYLGQKNTIEYDENGAIISKSYECYNSDQTLRTKGTREYYADGTRKSEEWQVYTNGNVTTNRSVEFNEKGQLTSNISTYFDKDANGNYVQGQTVKTTDYQYDKNGNLTGYTDIKEKNGIQQDKVITVKTTFEDGSIGTSQLIYDSNNDYCGVIRNLPSGSFNIELANDESIASCQRINLDKNNYITTTNNGDPLAVNFDGYEITITNQNTGKSGLYNVNSLLEGNGWSDSQKTQILDSFKTMSGQAILNMFDQVDSIKSFSQEEAKAKSTTGGYYKSGIYSNGDVYLNPNYISDASNCANILMHEGGEGHGRDAGEILNMFEATYDKEFQSIVDAERADAVTRRGEYNNTIQPNAVGAYPLRSYGTDASSYDGCEVVAESGALLASGTNQSAITLMTDFQESLKYIANQRNNDKADISLISRAKQGYKDYSNSEFVETMADYLTPIASWFVN